MFDVLIEGFQSKVSFDSSKTPKEVYEQIRWEYSKQEIERVFHFGIERLNLHLASLKEVGNAQICTANIV